MHTRRSEGPRTAEAAALAEHVDATATRSRFGLYSIKKNFGEGIADEIIKERKENGRFVSLADFLSRIKTQGLNKKGLESLIECGALDSLGERGEMLANLEFLLQFHRDAAGEQSQDSLFMGGGPATLALKRPRPLRRSRRAWVGKKSCLACMSPAIRSTALKTGLKPRTPKCRAPNLLPSCVSACTGQTAVAAGMVADVRVILTKGGDQMAFIKLADYDGTIEAVIFPKSFAEFKNILKPDACIALKGRMSNRNGELSLVTEALKAL